VGLDYDTQPMCLLYFGLHVCDKQVETARGTTAKVDT